MCSETEARLIDENASLKRALDDAQRTLWLVIDIAANGRVLVPKDRIDQFDGRNATLVCDNFADKRGSVLRAINLAPPNARNKACEPEG